MDPKEITNIILAINAALALVSLTGAWLTARLSHRAGQVDALLKVAEWFREPDVVEARKRIYALDRDNYNDWQEADKKAVDIWVAYVDIVSTLVITRNIDRSDLIRMYGDVLFKTVYLLAPYVCQNQARLGHQYLKSTQIALPSLIRDWEKLSKRSWFSRQTRKIYPYKIMIRYENGSTLAPTTISPVKFKSDTAIMQMMGE